MSNANKGKKRVTFRLAAPDAGQVFISGDFNGWNAQKTPLNRKPGGFWEKTVMLAPGRHEYKFVVDGAWRLDPDNSLSCSNAFGSLNSVIEVQARPAGVMQKGLHPKF